MKFYLTTPLYYVNDVPHIGHAYTEVASDVFARWQRFLGNDVFFLTGTDEHGQKIEKAAIQANKPIAEMVQENAEKFKKLWNKLNISYDDFIRTTEDRHIQVVNKVLNILFENNDIYKDKYEGWYCVSCESFFPPTQIKEKKCPDCLREVEWVVEDAYFFRLSKYQNQLLEFIQRNPDFILPRFRCQEIINFIKQGLKDLNISRRREKNEWAIPLPFDQQYNLYVWVDALINYISAIDFGNKEKFNYWWPCDIHFIGKDILKFHAIIWPALLFALGIEPPRKIFAHGWWLVNGEKMSKSKGNAVDPESFVDNFGADSFRYFILRHVPFGLDGDFSYSAFVQRYNAELANDLGNLFLRISGMLEKYFFNKIPEKFDDNQDNLLQELIEEKIPLIEKGYEELAYHHILDYIWEIISAMNKYIEETAPWELAKKKKNSLNGVIYNLLEGLRIVSLLIYPFLPETSEKITNFLGEIPPHKQRREQLSWGILPAGRILKNAQVLFPRK